MWSIEPSSNEIRYRGIGMLLRPVGVAAPQELRPGRAAGLRAP
jgi:hypothetical protein